MKRFHCQAFVEIIWLILDEMDAWAYENFQEYLQILYKTMFSAAYYGLWRIGELTDGPHHILVNNAQ